MQKYVKPTISLTASVSANGPAFCSVQADLDLIQSITGLTITKDSFAASEACKLPLPVEFDIYCKFTSAELGAAQAFIS